MIKTKPTQEPRQAAGFDLIEMILKDEFNRHARAINHFNTMEALADSERGKLKWAHLSRLSQKLKDDILAALYAWKANNTLKAIADAFKTARDDRRELINWLEKRPQEDPRHIKKAAEEIGYFVGVFREILHTARDRVSRKSIQQEAITILATFEK